MNSYNNSIIHFDFHVDNLIWLPNRLGVKKVGLLDFQDAVLGPSVYDLASILRDVRREISKNLEAKMIDRFLEKIGGCKNNFYLAYNSVGAQRNTRIIGVFCRLLVRDDNSSYLPFLPRAWELLNQSLDDPSLIEIKKWFNKNIPSEIKSLSSKEDINKHHDS